MRLPALRPDAQAHRVGARQAVAAEMATVTDRERALADLMALAECDWEAERVLIEREAENISG